MVFILEDNLTATAPQLTNIIRTDFVSGNWQTICVGVSVVTGKLSVLVC